MKLQMYEEKSPLVTGLAVEDTSDLLPAKFSRLMMLSRLPPEPQTFGPPSFFLLQLSPHSAMPLLSIISDSALSSLTLHSSHSRQFTLFNSCLSLQLTAVRKTANALFR